MFWGADQFTYNDILRQTRALASHLQQRLRVSPGDRVGIWLKNCPEFVPVLFAILNAGGVVVPINNFLKPDEVSFIINDAGVNVLITDKSTAEALPKLTAARPELKFWLVEDFAQLPQSATDQQSQRGENDLAVIIYTSGTTGHPKGAMLSHGNLLSNVQS